MKAWLVIIHDRHTDDEIRAFLSQHGADEAFAALMWERDMVEDEYSEFLRCANGANEEDPWMHMEQVEVEP